jgi:hypothetical protein
MLSPVVRILDEKQERQLANAAEKDEKFHNSKAVLTVEYKERSESHNSCIINRILPIWKITMRNSE